jgi:hypothetical protein
MAVEGQQAGQNAASQSAAQIVVRIWDKVQIALDIRALKWVIGFLIGTFVILGLVSTFVSDFRFYLYCVTGDSGYCEVARNEAHDYMSAVSTSDVEALRKYADGCKACQFSDEARESITEITHKKAAEKSEFDSIGNTLSAALQYLKACQICDYREPVIAIVERFSARGNQPAPIDAVRRVANAPVVPNGTYTAQRGYLEHGRSTARQACQSAPTMITNVSVQNGAITFTVDNRTWSGTINQQTGAINIDRDGVNPHPTTTTYIRGNFRHAKTYDGHCGRGYFKLNVS